MTKVTSSSVKLPDGAPLLTPVQIVELSNKVTALFDKLSKIIILGISVLAIELGVLIYIINNISDNINTNGKDLVSIFATKEIKSGNSSGSSEGR